MNLIERAYQLQERAHELLLKSTLTYREIAEGSGVGYEWLNKFSRSQIKQPGLDKIQPLHDFLNAHVASSSSPPRSPTVAKPLREKQGRRDISRRAAPESRLRKSPNRAGVV